MVHQYTQSFPTVSFLIAVKNIQLHKTVCGNCQKLTCCSLTTGKAVLLHVGEMIPKLKTRQGGASGGSSQTQAQSGSGGGKKKKGKKK